MEVGITHQTCYSLIYYLLLFFAVIDRFWMSEVQAPESSQAEMHWKVLEVLHRSLLDK